MLTIAIFLSIVAFVGNVQAGYSYQNDFVSSQLTSSENGEIFGKVLGVNDSGDDVGNPLVKATVSIKKYWASLLEAEIPAEPIKLESLGSFVSADQLNIASISDYSVKINSSSENEIEIGASKINVQPGKLVVSSKTMSVWQSTFTDENGEYSFSSLESGWYMVKASKYGYESSAEIINIEGDDSSVEVDFTLKRTPYMMITEEIRIVAINESKTLIREIGGPVNIQSIDAAIYEGDVGGEVIIGKNLESDVVVYNDHLSINEFSVEKNRVSLKINGDENITGKTLVINVEEGIFKNPNKMVVKYDGETTKIADDIDDVLNPDDDGSRPEYLVTHGANGTQIIVSIPHFSEHEITVYSVAEVVEALGGITAVILYIVICTVAAIVFVGGVRLRRRIK